MALNSHSGQCLLGIIAPIHDRRIRYERGKHLVFAAQRVNNEPGKNIMMLRWLCGPRGPPPPPPKKEEASRITTFHRIAQKNARTHTIPQSHKHADWNDPRSHAAPN